MSPKASVSEYKFNLRGILGFFAMKPCSFLLDWSSFQLIMLHKRKMFFISITGIIWSTNQWLMANDQKFGHYMQQSYYDPSRRKGFDPIDRGIKARDLLMNVRYGHHQHNCHWHRARKCTDLGDQKQTKQRYEVRNDCFWGSEVPTTMAGNY